MDFWKLHDKTEAPSVCVVNVGLMSAMTREKTQGYRWPSGMGQ